MRKLALALAFLLSTTLAAPAATVVITITAGAQVSTFSKTVTGPHLIRFIAAMRIAYNMTDTQAFTDAQVLQAWWNDVISQARARTRAIEAQAAADTATGAVTEITIDDTP